MGERVSVEGATVLVVGAGYPGKRRIYERMAKLGVKVLILEEAGHWSQALVEEGVASKWLEASITGNADQDAAAAVDALGEAGVRPDAVLTFWEDSCPIAARVAVTLGLPGNPVEAVDSARSKLRSRATSERAGLPTPRSRPVRSLDELFAAAAELGFPSVVKPEFGAGAIGCVRVDSFESLPSIYEIIRSDLATNPEADLRAGNDLLLEDYLDGVEFDVDMVLENGECVFSSVSQNWPTAEPSFQERGLHCPPDHSARAVRKLVDLCARTAQAFGFQRGVLHIEGKCTTNGPRIVEVNARMGGGRIHQIVEAVWGVDLIGAQVRSALGLPQQLKPSRKPRCAVVNALVYAPASGRLEALPLEPVEPEVDLGLFIDDAAEVGEEVDGPDRIFSTLLADVTVGGKNLKRARSLVDQVLREPPVVVA